MYQHNTPYLSTKLNTLIERNTIVVDDYFAPKFDKILQERNILYNKKPSKEVYSGKKHRNITLSWSYEI